MSKHIKSLQEMGLDIFKVSGKGYSLNNHVGLLEQAKIQQHYQALGATPRKWKSTQLLIRLIVS